MIRGRVARVVVLAAVLGSVTAGTASAAPAGNAAFVQAGVQVYPDDAVGPSCRVLGFCDGVAGALAESATPGYLSRRPGEAVLVSCQSAGVARVVGFFARGEDVVTGWANAAGLRVRADAPVPACGALA